MKKILAVGFVAALALGFMAGPAHAAQTSRLISDSGFCGPSNNKKVSVDSGQHRRDQGTPNAPYDDEINFDYYNDLTSDVRISVPNQDLGDLSYRYAQIIKTVSGNREVVGLALSTNDNDVHVNLNFDNDIWHDVTKEPIVKVTAVFDGGAECVARAKWNSDW